MSNYAALPSSGHRVAWVTWDGAHEARVELTWENEGWTANCTLESERAQVVVRLSASWMVQQFIVFRDLDEPDLWLATDGHGRWGEMNGAHRTELDGCTDIDFVNTPFTNCIPIRRLPLLVGHSATISVAVIDIETLGITKQTQQYTKVSPNTWRYFSVAANCEVEANVDEFGFVIDEPNRFQRIT